ncbi:MAG TPA: acyloxyacyl hydrolase [Verrucomicrobiae bacterium]|nr:acyloxyacyl hydrolase [Verrucomicrobiae bacterium]
MTHRFGKNGRRILPFTVSCIVLFIAGRACAQDFFAGARGGISLEADRFRQAEAFGGINFPWHWRLYSNWFLRPGADASVGWISDDDTRAFIGSIGPFVELGKGRFPLTFEGGAAPTFMTRHHFKSRNFGDNFQFTTHFGLNWRISDHFTAGVRFQHMSNAGITHINPGVNLEFLSLRYDF